MCTMKSEPETSPEYDKFKALLSRIIAVPREVMLRREAQYRRESEMDLFRRGPKPKRKAQRKA